MEYNKCENYPRCTFVECECHQKMLFEEHLKSNNKIKSDNRKIIRFEMVDGVAKPIYEKSNISK